MQEGTEGELPSYPTPDELWNLTFAEANAWRDRFATVPFEDRGGYFQSRYYQDIAIERTLEAALANPVRLGPGLSIVRGRRCRRPCRQEEKLPLEPPALTLEGAHTWHGERFRQDLESLGRLP